MFFKNTYKCLYILYAQRNDGLSYLYKKGVATAFFLQKTRGLDAQAWKPRRVGGRHAGSRARFAFWKAAAALRPQRELGPSRSPTRALSWVYQRPRMSLLSHAGVGAQQGRPRFSLVAVSSANGNRRSSNGVGSGMSRRGAPGVTRGSTCLSAQLDQQSVYRAATLKRGQVHESHSAARTPHQGQGPGRSAGRPPAPGVHTEGGLRPARNSASDSHTRGARTASSSVVQSRPDSSLQVDGHTRPALGKARAECARCASPRAEVSLVARQEDGVSHVAPAVVSEAHEQMPSENRTEQSSQQRGFCE